MFGIPCVCFGRPATHRHSIRGRPRSKSRTCLVRSGYVMDCSGLNIRLGMQVDLHYTTQTETCDETHADGMCFMETLQCANLFKKT